MDSVSTLLALDQLYVSSSVSALDMDSWHGLHGLLVYVFYVFMYWVTLKRVTLKLPRTCENYCCSTLNQTLNQLGRSFHCGTKPHLRISCRTPAGCTSLQTLPKLLKEWKRQIATLARHWPPPPPPPVIHQLRYYTFTARLPFQRAVCRSKQNEHKR